MKTINKIGLGLGFISAFFTCVIFLGVNHPGHSQAIPVPQNINLIAGYLKDSNYHFWVDPTKPATINAQIPKDNDPTKNLYFFKHNSTKNGSWVYTTAGTSNPDLFCSGTSITTTDLSGLPSAQTPQSNIVGDFKYVYPGNISKCSPPLGRGEINPLAIDVTTNASGVPGSGVKGAPCTSGADCVNGVCQKDGGLCSNTSSTSQSDQSCESNFNSPLGWIICPALSLADSAAGAFNGFVDDQLCFKTTDQSSSSTGSSVVCKGNNNLDTSVQNAWSIFKNIASALLVIVMLVMVFSQAIGGGPVDAYTARKMLPKLVAAVIIMQLSWILLKFAIDLSNDIGKSIAAIMEAPFGGINNLTLKSMVSVDLSAHGTGTNNVVFFSALAAGAVGAVALSIPGLAMLALYVVLALLTAFIVLLLRKLLIILLVILAPVALILWILPGTERYWKMWWDNFIKLIAMFPLIMAIIAAGRIFADITAGNSAVMFNIHLAVAHIGPLTVPYVASFSNFADLAIIIGAFFGPYFFLPQTFKWGGMAMGAISQGVKQGMERGAKPAQEYLGWRKENTRFALARKQRKALQEQRFKRNFAETLQQQGGPGIRGRLRGLRGTYERSKLLGVGSIGGEQEILERASRSAEAEVTKAEREEDEFAMLRMQQEIDRTTPQNHDALMRARALGQTQYEERDINGNRTGRVIDIGETSLRDQIAASRKLLTLGGTGNLQAYEQAYDRALRGPDGGEGSERLELFKRGIGAEIGTISPQLPHIIKGVNAAVDQLNEDSFASLSGAEMQTLLGTLSQQIAAGGPGAVEAQRRLENLTTKFQSALHTQGKVINTGAAEAMSSFLDIEGGQPGLITINADRGVAGTPSIIGAESRRVDAAARRDIVDTLRDRGIRPTP